MTIMEHFEQAKKDGHEWADKAIKNRKIVLGRNRKDGDDAPDLPMALISAFDWDDTKEGVGYWKNIYESIGGEIPEQ